MKKFILFVLFSIFLYQAYGDEFTITYRAPESEFDTRFDYPLELIKTAMEKTKSEYGSYKLVAAPDMNFQRAQDPNFIKNLENFVFENAASKENEDKLLSIKIPIAKGLYGYRVFLINRDQQMKFNNVRTLEDLKAFTVGQGRTWLDVKILENSGFNVVKGVDYEGLFRMVIRGRFDLFSRGVNEAFHERDDRINDLPSLEVEKNLCLYYPLPRFFYTSKENTFFAKRLTEGLELMLDDGSFDRIWRKYHSEFLEEAKLEKRRIFSIPNPFVPDVVPLDNPKYWYKPN